MATLTSAEYAELLAMANIEPIGWERADMHAAAAASVMGAKIKGSDFRYTRDPDMSDDEIFNALSGVVVYGEGAGPADG